MTNNHTSRIEKKSNPGDSKITFSPRVREEFENLADAVQSNEKFDLGVLITLQRWANGEKPTVDTYIKSMPQIAMETIFHVRDMEDRQAEHAWSEISSFLGRGGYEITAPQKGKDRG